MKPKFGFREHAHTADWELEVWAPNLATLLEQAAHGMYALSGMHLDEGSPHERSIAIRAADAENLLVRFLTELLWLEQVDRLGFNQFSIRVDHNFNLTAEIHGGPVTSLNKEIKAVTYHNMKVETKPEGLSVNIVFDV